MFYDGPFGSVWSRGQWRLGSRAVYPGRLFCPLQIISLIDRGHFAVPEGGHVAGSLCSALRRGDWYTQSGGLRAEPDKGTAWGQLYRQLVIRPFLMHVTPWAETWLSWEIPDYAELRYIYTHTHARRMRQYLRELGFLLALLFRPIHVR